MASFIMREGIELIGVEAATGTAVIWCGLHDIDWQSRQCDTGYWVRTSAQGQGFATEAANALVRYAFAALGMRRIGLTHSAGNDASRRIAERLGFSFEGIQRGANILPGGKYADRYCYARFDVAGLPDLEVQWPARIGIITGPISPREKRLMLTGLVNSQWVQAGRYHSSTSTSSSMWGQVPQKPDLPPRSALPGCETSCEQD